MSDLAGIPSLPSLPGVGATATHNGTITDIMPANVLSNAMTTGGTSSSVGLPSSSTGSGGALSTISNAVTTFESDSFITKITVIILSIVIIGAALFLLGKNQIINAVKP